MIRKVLRPIRHEIDKLKKSRFIATALPIRSEADIAEQVDVLRREFPDANHHCWAYRLGERAERFRYNDDGEPSGSAGRPILQRIEGLNLTDTAVIVTRIFGGTKLGVGGLIRAYGAAAAAALERAELAEMIPLRRVRLTFPIALGRLVDSILRAAEVAPASTDYGADVTMELEIPEKIADALIDELRERTAGRAAVHRLD